jgi:hypothetical protein
MDFGSTRSARAHKRNLVVQWNALPRTWIGSILGCLRLVRLVVVVVAQIGGLLFCYQYGKGHIRLNAD